MILQILADAGKMVSYFDARLLQLLAVANAGEHQEARTLDRTGGENDLPLRADLAQRTLVPVFDADRALALEQHARRVGVGDHGQIRARVHRLQIAARRAAAPATFLRHLERPDALWTLAVEILVEREAGFKPGVDEDIGQPVGAAQVGHIERPARAVIRRRAAFLVLRALEVRQHVGERPARIAERRPFVVVGGMSAQVAHGVRRTAAAQRAATRPEHAPAAHLRLALGVEIPVEGLAAHHPDDAHRHVDQRMAIGRSRFQQTDRDVTLFAQAVSQNAAGRTAADDDVIEDHRFLDIRHEVTSEANGSAARSAPRRAA